MLGACPGGSLPRREPVFCGTALAREFSPGRRSSSRASALPQTHTLDAQSALGGRDGYRDADPMRVLIAFASLSGNTRDVARMVRACCEARGHAVTWIEADIAGLEAAGEDPRHDLYLLGAWTDNAGRTPVEMKRFIAALVEAVGMPGPIAAFGTGETQWGEAYYCGAVRRISRYFDSPYPTLEIEQMPHGERDALRIRHWTDHILTSIENARHADPARVVA